ncbi:MAG: ATP synthase F1 subunit gamma [Anaerolineaceae bacterium]|jgi:F-type H+-transporting ATPase subunit gamma|nr:MAG: ATP synthase F1 subunit gamma [Chloroflexi bacterium HGW-Chloroflexi-8]
MTSAREMRIRIKSIKNLSQVTRALQTVSASKVRKSMQAVNATSPYAEKAWKVLVHLARQSDHQILHPLLATRPVIKNTLVILITSDRGLAGSYNVNIVRKTLQYFLDYKNPVTYIAVGKKGRDLLIRRKLKVMADFNQIPTPPRFTDVSSIGWLAVDEFLEGSFDEVFVSYTKFHNMLTQVPEIRRILPLDVELGNPSQFGENITHHKSSGVFSYEPGQEEILDAIVPRFTNLQIYQSILSAQASENAARMIAMQNATENATELISVLQMEYNKARQQSITNEMLDIAGGAEALNQVQTKMLLEL